MRRSTCAGAVAAALATALAFASCRTRPEPGPPPATTSYRGHENDADIACFVRAYPDAAGTRLDDCVLCHTEGDAPDRRGRPMRVNACDYCHYVLQAGEPGSATLNRFGRSWSERGRDERAFRAIEGEDSDGDGHANLAEIRAGCFPGREASRPDLPAAPTVVRTRDEIRSLASHEMFLLLNAHTQRTDEYVTYRGVRVIDLLRSAGVDPEAIDGITVFAPDGYAKTFSREQVVGEYPAGVFRAGLDDAALGEAKGIVDYPARVRGPSLRDGETIPGRRFLLLAFERNFEPLAVSILDPVDRRIRGEGPYRIVRPPRAPSRPDRGTSLKLGDGRDFDESLDHNAGDCVRGVTVIRVDPTPPGYEEFDARNASWRFLEQGKLVLYGAGIR